MADRPWPPALRFSEVMLELRGLTRTGGQTFSGIEQVVGSPAARWVGTMTVPIADRRYGRPEHQDAVLAWRWMKAGGRASTILVPAKDGRGPAHRARIVPCGYAVSHDDGAMFSDGSGFGQTFTGATLAEAASMNATQIRINLPAGLELLPGMRFSMPGGRLHEIVDLIDQAGTIWTVQAGPWTWAAWPAGTPLEFDQPLCRMRLASDEAGSLSLSLNRFSTPTIEFVEAL